MRKISVAIVSLLTVFLLSGGSALAAKGFPAEFIEYTGEIFDALDIVETLFSKADTTVFEADLSMKKLDIALKKYERLGRDPWRDKLAQKIRLDVLNAALTYKIYRLNPEIKSLQAAIELTNSAKDGFVKYKARH